MFKDKILLISGGTGSFGETVLRHFLDSDLKEIRILSRDEKKQFDLRKKYQSSKLKFYIGDVRDIDSINAAMRGVHFVFHAAALKQVPSCEFYPMEAYKTNVLGTSNILESAINYEVEKVICLSTDKAVYPINAMGISKAMMEKLVVAKSREIEGGKTTICATRYGNVMASRGSVIPLFIKQIKENKPITITDPEMTRFIMSLDDALDLVMFAFNHGKNGDIFVQKSPSATTQVLGEAVREVLNKPNHPITVMGTRHGEKLYETLVTREEISKAIEHDKYFQVLPDNRDLNYEKYLNEGAKKITDTEDYHSHNTSLLTTKELTDVLYDLREIQDDLIDFGVKSK